MPNFEQIKEAIKQPVNAKFIQRGRDIANRHDLHTTGNGLQDYIDKIDGIEDDAATSLRRALLKEATVPVTSNVLKPVSKVFNAQGGGKFYNIESENLKDQFIQLLKKATTDNSSVNEWMATEWRNVVNIDPNGLAFIEVSEDGKSAYVTYKSIYDIHDIGISGNTITYIVFKPYFKGKNQVYRVVTNETDSLYVREGNGFYETDILINQFGYVPATFLSNRTDLKTRNAFQTWIYESMPVLDDLLFDYSIYNIYKKVQGIPLVWEYQSECPTCEGSGYVEDKNGNSGTCGVCNGDGIRTKRAASEVRYLPPPENDEKALTPPAGYIQPDLATWEQFETTINEYELKAFSSVWGDFSQVDKTKTNTTAFEVSTRLESQKDLLDQISQNAEHVHKFIVDSLGVFYLGNAYGGCSINYGRRYINQNSNQIWEEYQTALTNNVSTTELTELLENYYYSLHKNNDKKLKESLNKLYTKPFFHSMPADLKALGIDNNDYIGNLYYDAFVVEYEKKQSIASSTIDEIQIALTIYVEAKTINNE